MAKIYQGDYKELEQRALSHFATKQDIINLYRWFELYGGDYWNGEEYAITKDRALKPIYQAVEFDEDGEPVEWVVVDVEIR